MRSGLAVLAGIIAGSIVNMLVVVVSVMLFPLPAGLDMSDSVAMQTYIAGLPLLAFVLVWLAHAGGTLAGAWLAARISQRHKYSCAMIVGTWFLAMGALNLYQLRHPVIFMVIDLASYLPAAWLAWWLVCRNSNATPEALAHD